MDNELLRTLSEIGNALTNEPDVDRILETILLGAKQLTRADGATLYKVIDRRLRFAMIQSNTLESTFAGSDELGSSFPSIALLDDDGTPNTRMVVAFAVNNDVTVNVDDAYQADGFDFSGTRSFDRLTGYRSRSFLTVPIKDANEQVIAAMQLINAMDESTGEITGFTTDHQRLVESLACQASVALEKHRLSWYENALMGSLRIEGEAGSRQVTKAQLVTELELCALPPALAEAMSKEILSGLVEQEELTVDEGRLHELILEVLETRAGPGAARRYQAWQVLKTSGIPLVVLLGGTTGTGKSTVAAELALRLDIGRIQSTDSLREVLRLLLPEHLAPEVHASSYDAWRTLPCPPEAEPGEPERLIEGYRSQADKVLVAVDGVVRRALTERVSVIIEGIHVPPSYRQRLGEQEAIVVQVLLAITDQAEFQARFLRRGETAPARSSGRYMQHLESIWRVQNHFLEEARAHGVPVIPNIRPEQTVRQVLGLIADKLVDRFDVEWST